MGDISENILVGGEEQATTLDQSAGDITPPKRKAQKRQRRNIVTTPEPEAWSPPNFGDQRRTRIGASIVEQFVAGHNPSDVLRELVQNEFDGGGDRLTITFGEDSLDVIGNGRGINADGWKRLSVIVGTGRVVGEDTGERVAPKTNGIGSKNFGLRSLFLFGDEIYVRSRGHVAILDLPTLETGRVQDIDWWGGPGVRLKVPYRQRTFEKLEPFTAEKEKRVFETMAGGMLVTLVKLALAGQRPGLRELVLRSVRNGRTLSWRQKAEALRCHMRGVSALRRVGQLTDQRDDATNTTRTSEELEFTRLVQLPTEYANVSYPNYYRKPGGNIKISVSLPIARRRIDLTQTGNFYYPLQAPDSRTGCAVSVSAPFDLDNDRSSLVDNEWNRWLIDQAVAFTIDLLKEDWFRRFGADAFKALIPKGPATPVQFAEAIARCLSEKECWPTRAAKPSEQYAKASELVLPEAPQLDGLMRDSRYIVSTLQVDEEVRALAIKSGMVRFTVSSLVRLRCAGKDQKELQTKIDKGEANYSYSPYESSLSDPDRQVRMAAALTALSRHLSKANRADLRSSPSTLTATGQLKPAKDLVRVDSAIWEICPEPLENRLHPNLVAHRAIADLCQAFDEQDWIVSAAGRARDGRIKDTEREALYAKLLADGTKISRRALAALRDSPIVRNQRGEWIAPSRLVLLKGAQARLMSPVVSAPSKEILARSELLARLKIRKQLNSDDILAYAISIGERPHTAQRFETLLNDNQRLLTRAIIEKLDGIRFLRARSGELACPSDLHLDTPTNRLCLNNENRIVGGPNEALYRLLRIRERPTLETLQRVLASSRERSEAPSHPDVFYPTLVSALGNDRAMRASLADQAILWVGTSYHPPKSVLVGTHIPRFFDGAVPVLRRADTLSRAYLALGAHEQPKDEHWIQFFEHVSEKLDNGKAISPSDRRALLDAYYKRGAAGLPEDLDKDACCLLDRQGFLFSLSDLQAGLLVEDDYPALADALAAAGSTIGIADLNERSRTFFQSLGIRPLTLSAGAGTAIFGVPKPPPLWFKSGHRDQLLAMLHRPLFARSLHELAVRQRHATLGFHPVGPAELQRRLEGITGLAFLDTIFREYRVNDHVARVSIETAVQDGIIGLVEPRTRLDFQQLVAQSLAEVAGADNAAQARTLSTAFLPLVLCRTADDMLVYLERMGVNIQRWSNDIDDHLEQEDDEPEDISEEILRQVMQGLNTTKHDSDKAVTDSLGGSGVNSSTPAPPPVPAPTPAPLPLPDLGEVAMSVASANGQQIQPRVVQGASYGGSSGGWFPRGSSEVERDRDVGRRGEELVYLMELDRVRAMGHDKPEELVIWTSQADPGADHDIRSISEDGFIRWIEVKSTTGTDGRFEWSRKEFEKALREGDRYELWRVYQAATTSPVAKRFTDPAGLLVDSRLVLELGSLRAYVEGLS